MIWRFQSRRRRLIGLSLAAVVVGGAIGGAAYSFSSETSGGTSLRTSDVRGLRADFTARVRGLHQGQLAPAPASAFNTLRATVDGRDWTFSTYRNVAGDQCMMEAIPGEGRGYGCQPRTSLLARGPLYATWGSRQDPAATGDLAHWDAAWVEGLAAPPVASVEVILTNCVVIKLPLSADGAFLGVIGQQAMRGDSLPYVVQGRAASGAVVQKTEVKLAPLSTKSGNIGQPTAPQAAPACR